MATHGGALHTPPSGPQPANPQSAPNLVGFDPKHAVPQQPIYLQRNDFVFLNLISNITNCIVRMGYRFLTPEGEIKEGTFTTSPFTGSFTGALEIWEGWFLSFAAAISNGPVTGGWAYLQTEIVRGFGPGNNGSAYGVFWEGFLYANAITGWPGVATKEITDGAGVLRSITGSTPAAGADINEVVPAQRRWNLISLSTFFTTSATVATRAPDFLIDDGANTLFASEAIATQAASLGQRYSLSPVVPSQAFVFGSQLIAFPFPLPLKAGFRIKSQTQNIQAGDQWTAPQYLVQEWGAWDP